MFDFDNAPAPLDLFQLQRFVVQAGLDPLELRALHFTALARAQNHIGDQSIEVRLEDDATANGVVDGAVEAKAEVEQDAAGLQAVFGRLDLPRYECVVPIQPDRSFIEDGAVEK
ncbi:hypothetical protein IEQ11_09995 [Lysobacter capsici]|uniref:hypothetical protein n=1 Tax=Lysobacter capsici TaxID=435897 RepID=UPI00177AE2FB|nr:hypothetical protein [Lysobacter capsici]UOF16931.1 hypothetical protein IEQ11_09995 [Lysobacter capsici]